MNDKENTDDFTFGLASLNVDIDLSPEAIMELGKKGPYYRAAEYWDGLYDCILGFMDGDGI